RACACCKLLSVLALLSSLCFFFFLCYAVPRDLHSFPTRRSSDLANQVVSVGADIAFDADPKFFACLVRFESSSVPTTLPTAKQADRKSGSAGMPRPSSYAVFCLKKKIASQTVTTSGITGLRVPP